MTTQQLYDFKKLPDSKRQPSFDIGEANIVWQGKRLTSTIVFFSKGLIIANYLKAADGSHGGGTDNDAVVICLLKDTPDSSFDQDYIRGVTPHHFGWAFQYAGVMYYPKSGSTSGTFKNGYRSIESVTKMLFEDSAELELTFKAQKRIKKT